MTLCFPQIQNYRFGNWVVIAFRVRQESEDNLIQTFNLHIRDLSLKVLHHYRCTAQLHPQHLLNENAEIHTLLGETGQIYR